MLLGGLVATLIVLSGIDFTTLVLTTYALKTSILLPLVLAILWPRTNTVGFVGGVVLAILIGMPIYETQGELIGTLSIVAISGITVLDRRLLPAASASTSRACAALAMISLRTRRRRSLNRRNNPARRSIAHRNQEDGYVHDLYAHCRSRLDRRRRLF